MRIRIVGLLSVVFLGIALQAGDFWLKKDYRQWLESECRYLLQESPWAKSYVLSQAHIELIEATPSTDRGRERNPRIEYHVQLRSALPLRQALLRLAQLRADYDDMFPEEQLGFDSEMTQVLGVGPKDVVIIHVTYATNVPLWDRELDRYWRNQSTETLRNSTWLIGREGQRAPLNQFIKGAGEPPGFVLLFPRRLNGEDLVGPGDKRLALKFVHPSVGEASRRILVQFPVKKMLIDGVVAY
jgi:hypothetical protein